MDYFKIVNKNFSFLEKFGYKAFKSENESCVRYVGMYNIVLISFSNCTNEIDIQFADLSLSKCFSLQEALDCKDVCGKRGLYQFSNTADIVSGIEYTSEVVKELFGISNLSISREFDQIFELTSTRRKEKLEEYYIKEALTKADNLWSEGKYDEAVKIYKKYHKYLTKSQKKKIELIDNKHNGLA